MKNLCALLLVMAFPTVRSTAAPSISAHQWVELPQKAGGGSFYCDLARAALLTVVGDRAVASTEFPAAGGQKSAYCLFEDDLAVAQAVLRAAQSLPERWMRVDVAHSAEGEFRFVNLEVVAAVRFGSDEKGDFARVVLCGESIMQERVAAKNPAAGWEVRDKEDIQRLKRTIIASP